jgi:hypothetical protein
MMTRSRSLRRGGTATAGRRNVGVFITVLGVAMVSAVPTAFASSAPRALVSSFHRAILGAPSSDVWFADDGCTGGSRPQDPLLVTPVEELAESACTARVGVPIVVVPASITCFDLPPPDAKAECEQVWNDEAGKLLTAAASVDGVDMVLRHSEIAGSAFIPLDGFLSVFFGFEPGPTAMYGISESVIVRGLTPGTHTIEASFEFADGFAADTTFTITIGR